jgi:hypothetical protein
MMGHLALALYYSFVRKKSFYHVQKSFASCRKASTMCASSIQGHWNIMCCMSTPLASDIPEGDKRWWCFALCYCTQINLPSCNPIGKFTTTHLLRTTLGELTFPSSQESHGWNSLQGSLLQREEKSRTQTQKCNLERCRNLDKHFVS